MKKTGINEHPKKWVALHPNEQPVARLPVRVQLVRGEFRNKKTEPDLKTAATSFTEKSQKLGASCREATRPGSTCPW
jgi:hypothetical protein